MLTLGCWGKVTIVKLFYVGHVKYNLGGKISGDMDFCLHYEL